MYIKKRDLEFEERAVNMIFKIMVLLRRMFLSGSFGARVHNIIYYIGWHMFRSGYAAEKRLMTALQSTLSDNCQSIFEWQKQIYLSAPKVWEHCFKTKFVRRRIFGTLIKRKLNKAGYLVPSFIVISPNSPGSGCNLHCKTCYASGRKEAEMSPEVFRKILIDQEELGIYTVMISGGEPFLYSHLWEIMREFPQTSFSVVTNGLLVTRQMVEEMANLGNICPVFSLEGFEAETDEIRGRGVFGQVMEVVSFCQEALLPYAVTVTVTTNNFSSITSDRFIGMLKEKRCMGIIYSTYVALGDHPYPEWEITTEQSLALDEVRLKIREECGMMASIGRSGTELVTSCNAGNQYIHILANGLVEGCHFVHYTDPEMNIRDHSILEITSSRFFTQLRALTANGLPGFVPCRAHKNESIRRYLESIAKPT